MAAKHLWLMSAGLVLLASSGCRYEYDLLSIAAGTSSGGSADDGGAANPNGGDGANGGTNADGGVNTNGGDVAMGGTSEPLGGAPDPGGSGGSGGSATGGGSGAGGDAGTSGVGGSGGAGGASGGSGGSSAGTGGSSAGTGGSSAGTGGSSGGSGGSSAGSGGSTAGSGGAGGSGGTGGPVGSSPTAVITASPRAVEVGQAVTFNSAGSSDPEDGTALAFAWDFDGNQTYEGSGASGTSFYPSPGTYNATLRVTDSDANTAFAVASIYVVAAGTLVTVTTTVDEADLNASPINPQQSGLSLREAFTYSNATAGRQVVFIPSGMLLAPNSNLPILSDALDIVGYGAKLNGTNLPNNRNCINIQAGNTTLSGLEVYNCPANAVQIQNNNSDTVRDCYIHDSGGCIFTAASTGHIIERNEMTACVSFGISVNSTVTSLLRNNFHGITGDAIFLAGGSAGSKVIGNRIEGGQHGINVQGANNVIWFNTVAKATTDGMLVQDTGTDVRNNIFFGSAGYGVSAAAAGNLVVFDYNLVFGNTTGQIKTATPGVHTLQVDPLFVNAAGGNYALTSSSPAIDYGQDVGFDRNFEQAGPFSGTAPDLGYLEAK